MCLFSQRPTTLIAAFLILLTLPLASVFSQPAETSSSQAEQVRSYLQSGEIAEARKTVLTAIEDGVPDPMIYLLAAEIFGRTQESERAVEVLQKGIVQFPELPELYAMLGRFRLAEGSFDEAIRVLESSVARSGRNARYVDNLATAHYQKGMAAFRARSYFVSLSSARRAIELSPDRAEFHHLAGLSNFVMRQFSDAEKELDRAVELASENAGYQYDLALACVELRKLDKAEALLVRSIELDPKSPMAHLYLGRLLHNEMKLDEAVDHFSVALTLDQDLQGGHYHLGYAHKARGDDRKAIEEMEKEVERHPGYLPARIELGDLYLRVGEPEAAEAHLRRGLEINPKLARGHYLLGKALADLKRETEALTSFQTAAELDPRMPEPDYAMSQIYMKQGKLDLAQQYVQTYKEKKFRSGQP